MLRIKKDEKRLSKSEEYGFIGRFSEEHIFEIKSLNKEQYTYIRSYKSGEQSGYTEKKLEWSCIKDYSEKPHVSLEQVYKQL